MGIQTDLATTTGATYSVNGGPFEPYNPALILGGLETGVTPLEMAHAYKTLAHDGQLVSGTMADSTGGPVGIQQGRPTRATTRCRDQPAAASGAGPRSRPSR